MFLSSKSTLKKFKEQKDREKVLSMQFLNISRKESSYSPIRTRLNVMNRKFPERGKFSAD